MCVSLFVHPSITLLINTIIVFIFIKLSRHDVDHDRKIHPIDYGRSRSFANVGVCRDAMLCSALVNRFNSISLNYGFNQVKELLNLRLKSVDKMRFPHNIWTCMYFHYITLKTLLKIFPCIILHVMTYLNRKNMEFVSCL